MCFEREDLRVNAKSLGGNTLYAVTTQIAEAIDENTLRQRFEREDLRVNEKSLGGNTLAVLPSRLDNV